MTNVRIAVVAGLIVELACGGGGGGNGDGGTTGGELVYTFSLDGVDLDFSSGASTVCANGAKNGNTPINFDTKIPTVQVSTSEDCDHGKRLMIVTIPVQPLVVGSWSCAEYAKVLYKDADLGGGVAGVAYTTEGDSSTTPEIPIQTCTVSVSSVTATAIEGTFSATLRSRRNDGSPLRSVTSGHFRMPPPL